MRFRGPKQRKNSASVFSQSWFRWSAAAAVYFICSTSPLDAFNLPEATDANSASAREGASHAAKEFPARQLSSARQSFSTIFHAITFGSVQAWAKRNLGSLRRS